MASETLEDKKTNEDVPAEEKAAAAEVGEEKGTSDIGEKNLKEESAEEEGKPGEEEEEPSKKAKGSRKRSSKKVVGGVDAGAGGESKKSGEESTQNRPRKRSSTSTSKEPVTPVDRPVRERKSVERYSALSSEKAPTTKGFSIEKGRGTQLKDIPNVAFKLSKRKPDENLQMLHTILFGKKAKVQILKRNISQFSGYVWLQNEEKQRAKTKEKLDKFVKEKLLDFCDVLDIPISKATMKKEELSAKLLEFLESPHATTEVSLADKEQSQKGKKRKRKAAGGTKITSGKSSGSGSNKKTKQSPEVTKKHKHVSEVEEKVEHEDEPGSAGTSSNSDGDDDSDRVQKEESDEGASESEKDEDRTSEQMESVEGSSKIMKGSEANTKAKVTPVKKDKATKSAKTPAKSTKGSSTSAVKKGAAAADRVSASPTKSKASGTKKQMEDEKRRPKHLSTSVKGKSTSEKQPSKSGAKGSTREQVGEGKASKKSRAEPSREEMHAIVSIIVKEVDFNTATLSDIIRQLGTHFGMDLMHRKAEVKGIIEDVINNMTDEDDDGADGEDDDNTEKAEGEDDEEVGKDNDD